MTQQDTKAQDILLSITFFYSLPHGTQWLQSLSPQLCSQASITLPNPKYTIASTIHDGVEGLVFGRHWGWLPQSWYDIRLNALKPPT